MPTLGYFWHMPIEQKRKLGGKTFQSYAVNECKL